MGVYDRFISKMHKKREYFTTSICLTDNTRMEVENCKQILEYNDVYVKIRTSTLIVGVWGRDMSISDYNTDGIIISGKFSSVEFESGGKKSV